MVRPQIPEERPSTDAAEATDIAFLPATEMAARIAQRQIGARELLEHHLDRVVRLNPQLNAIIWMDSRGAPYVREVTGGPIEVMGYAPLKALRWIRLTGGAW